jgi:hypothetical protein
MCKDMANSFRVFLFTGIFRIYLSLNFILRPIFSIFEKKIK